MTAAAGDSTVSRRRIPRRVALFMLLSFLEIIQGQIWSRIRHDCRPRLNRLQIDGRGTKTRHDLGPSGRDNGSGIDGRSDGLDMRLRLLHSG